MDEEKKVLLEGFANRLRDAREKAGYSSARDFAKEVMKIAPTSYANWEAGKAMPQIDSLMKLCRYFHVSPNDLLGFSNADDDFRDAVKLWQAGGWKVKETNEGITLLPPYRNRSKKRYVIPSRIEFIELLKTNSSSARLFREMTGMHLEMVAQEDLETRTMLQWRKDNPPPPFDKNNFTDEDAENYMVWYRHKYNHFSFRTREIVENADAAYPHSSFYEKDKEENIEDDEVLELKKQLASKHGEIFRLNAEIDEKTRSVR